MDYKEFKKDCESMDIFDFIDKWKNHPKYEEFEEKKYDENFYEYVCEYYDYDKYNIREWNIFKNTCEIYVKLLNNYDK